LVTYGLVIQDRDNEEVDDGLGEEEYDAEMANRVRDKLKRSAEEKDTEARVSLEDVFSYNRSKKRKLVYAKDLACYQRSLQQLY